MSNSLKTRSHQRGDHVCFEITQVQGILSRTYETITVYLNPETARMLGVSLTEDAAAADCYRREMSGPAEQPNYGQPKSEEKP